MNKLIEIAAIKYSETCLNQDSIYLYHKYGKDSEEFKKSLNSTILSNGKFEELNIDDALERVFINIDNISAIRVRRVYIYVKATDKIETVYIYNIILNNNEKFSTFEMPSLVHKYLEFDDRNMKIMNMIWNNNNIK